MDFICAAQSGFYTPSSDLDIALYGEVELKLLPENVRIEVMKLIPPGKETAPMVSSPVVVLLWVAHFWCGGVGVGG